MRLVTEVLADKNAGEQDRNVALYKETLSTRAALRAAETWSAQIKVKLCLIFRAHTLLSKAAVVLA